MERMQALYEKKGYPKEWIDKRMRGIAIRQDLTDEWKKQYSQGARPTHLTIYHYFVKCVGLTLEGSHKGWVFCGIPLDNSTLPIQSNKNYLEHQVGYGKEVKTLRWQRY